MDIEVDFEVYKQLTLLRENEEVTYNDVIRDLLSMNSGDENAGESVTNPWVWKGVRFPEGTRFRATYKGQQYFAEVQDGGLYYDGVKHKSPSSAAFEITQSGVNGWNFWECQMPEEDSWTVINELRSNG